MEVDSGSSVPRTRHVVGLEHGLAGDLASPEGAVVEVLLRSEDDTEN